MTESPVTLEARCTFCHATYESMERVGGEPAGWDPMARDYRCLGPKCIAQRSAMGRIAARQLARQKRDAVRPIAAKVREKRQTRKAKRSRIAADRNRKGRG